MGNGIITGINDLTADSNFYQSWWWAGVHHPWVGNYQWEALTILKFFMAHVYIFGRQKSQKNQSWSNKSLNSRSHVGKLVGDYQWLAV